MTSGVQRSKRALLRGRDKTAAHPQAIRRAEEAMETTARRRRDDAAAAPATGADAPVARMRAWGPVDILWAPENRETMTKLFKFMLAVAVCPPGARVPPSIDRRPRREALIDAS